jgi:hypothetical protein
MATTNKTLDVTFDFGFSAVNESELEAIQVLEERAKKTETSIIDTQNKLEAMYAMIVPLLDNLMADSEKTYIHWPNRKEKLQLFKQKLRMIIEQ